MASARPREPDATRRHLTNDQRTVYGTGGPRVVERDGQDKRKVPSEVRGKGTSVEGTSIFVNDHREKIIQLMTGT